ncbi:MAG: hypothetical protein K0R85_2173, partial [Devosia sp.]|nr:hypothetical protein [Devosia sp.]
MSVRITDQPFDPGLLSNAFLA